MVGRNETCSQNGGLIWVVPLPSNSDHQDYEPCLVGDSYKPSFATITGKGDNPRFNGDLLRYKVKKITSNKSKFFLGVNVASEFGSPEISGSQNYPKVSGTQEIPLKKK